MVPLFLFLVGFGFAVSGGVTIIAYLNFLPAGFSWMDYLIFIKERPECYLLPFGILFITIAVYLFPQDSC
ncbi:hypothetical protein N780_03355 [Pontibacillus chungwhensis BH030062]|uniref:Uncharacterized protein n=2 Tax=Pontibacillus TaxID=289201 RepID=A0A0A2UQZ0_9BACI|nr:MULTISPECIES: hypothetical protein [Pontibacillus]KGP90727.1 hypothetical protein N780_03355 [Pontibacillus chungwhensis BH030062]QST00813.1 hypothetical protein IMZ31_04360 [Pontibacillus sp. ALD_SL1]GGD18076.1 hypothetical protein GCM10011389_27330 [Pontibacillus salipaludis]